MAINKELQQYLSMKLQEEITAIDVDIQQLIKQNMKEFFELNQDKEEIKLITQAKEALNILNDKYNMSFGYEVRNLASGLSDFRMVPAEYARKGVKDLENKKKEVKEKYAKLNLKLSLTKDFDTINAILVEANIGIE